MNEYVCVCVSVCLSLARLGASEARKARKCSTHSQHGKECKQVAVGAASEASKANSAWNGGKVCKARNDVYRSA